MNKTSCSRETALIKAFLSLTGFCWKVHWIQRSWRSHRLYVNRYGCVRLITSADAYLHVYIIRESLTICSRNENIVKYWKTVSDVERVTLSMQNSIFLRFWNTKWTIEMSKMTIVVCWVLLLLTKLKQKLKPFQIIFGNWNKAQIKIKYEYWMKL